MYKFFALSLQMVFDICVLGIMLAFCLYEYHKVDLTDFKACVVLGLIMAFTMLMGVGTGAKWGMGVYRKELEDAEKKEKGEQK